MNWVSRVLGPVLALLLISGCSALNAENIPTRSGIDDGYELNVFFPDALNLADGAVVKIDGAVVGKVKEVSTEDFQAKVTLVIDGGTPLPRGTHFRLRPTTALGELFVEVLRGDGPGRLRPGATIPVDATRSAPTVEDGLAAASLLINGGSLSQIETIISEVNLSLDGRTDVIRDLFRGANDLLASLNDGQQDLDQLLRALGRTSRLLNEREAEINEAIEIAAPAAEVLSRNTPEVTALLTQLAEMTETADGLVQATRADLTRTLAELEPTVAGIIGSKARAKAALARVPRLAAVLDRAVPTDYLNLMLVLGLSAADLVKPGDGGRE